MSESSVPVPRPSEPLPCPFCGKKPGVRHYERDAKIRAGISCDDSDCGAWTGIVADSHEEAVAKWNRRSPSVPTAIQEHAPKCECGKLATCYGAYENQEPEFSCDECCGHGNEDGWCKHFSDMPTLTARLRELRGSEEAANSDTIRQTLSKIEAAWRKLPNLRLGQLIINALPAVHQNDPYYIEDSQLADFVFDFAARVQGENSQ